MATREVIVTEWECDNCHAKQRMDTESRDLPPNWTTRWVDVVIAGNPYKQGQDFCPACSKARQ